MNTTTVTAAVTNSCEPSNFFPVLHQLGGGAAHPEVHYPGIPTTIQTIGVNITTIAYLRVLIVGIGSTIILMVVEGEGLQICQNTMTSKGSSRFCGYFSRIESTF